LSLNQIRKGIFTMAEDDTFDIDIYGDDGQDQAQPDHQDGDDLIFDDDELAPQTTTEKPSHATNGTTSQDTPSAPQGTKRKAQDDEDDSGQTQQASTPSQTNNTQNTAIDPSAMPALRLAELHWWTTEEDVRAFCARAGVEGELREITFGEHKINGKSRGEAYLEFTSARAASATKAEIESMKTNDGAKKDGSTPTSAQRANPFTVTYCPVNNPFKGRDGGASGKKDYNNSGAYNNTNTNNNRGGYNNNFQNRGGYNNNRGGGGFQNNRGNFNNNRGGFQNHNNSQQHNSGMNPQAAANVGGWPAMNPMAAMNGFNPAMNPMMGMMNNMQQMGGFASMMAAQQRGGGAAGMMGRGAGMMGRGGMGMGGMMNGGAGAGRGGWGAFGAAGGAAGFNPAMMGQQQQGQQQGQGGFGMQGGQNKRMKSE
jgi:hypothetical protein